MSKTVFSWPERLIFKKTGHALPKGEKSTSTIFHPDLTAQGTNGKLMFAHGEILRVPCGVILLTCCDQAR
jgi:hypothetical protein